MSRRERLLFLLAIGPGSAVLLPTTVFVLMALWPQRVLVAWLLLGLVAAVVVMAMVIWLVDAVTMAKVRLAEEALRPGRLYSHERLVGQEGERRGDLHRTKQGRGIPEYVPPADGEKLSPDAYGELPPRCVEQEQ